jgi:chromosome segregation ATPase
VHETYVATTTKRARELERKLNTSDATGQEFETQLETLRAQLSTAHTSRYHTSQLTKSQAQLHASRAQVDSTQAQLDTVRTQFDATKPQLDMTRRQLESSQTQLDTAQGQLETASPPLIASITKKGRKNVESDDSPDEYGSTAVCHILWFLTCLLIEQTQHPSSQRPQAQTEARRRVLW